MNEDRERSTSTPVVTNRSGSSPTSATFSGSAPVAACVCNHACPLHCGVVQSVKNESNPPGLAPARSSPHVKHEFGTTSTSPLPSNPPVTAPTIVPGNKDAASSAKAHLNQEEHATSAPRMDKRQQAVTIGDMVDRLGEYQAAKELGLSKNKACELIKISKGTVGTHTLRMDEIVRYGLELGEFREYKWNLFRSTFRDIVSASGLIAPDVDEAQQTPEELASQASIVTANAAAHGDHKKLAGRGDALLDDAVKLIRPDKEVGPFILDKLKAMLKAKVPAHVAASSLHRSSTSRTVPRKKRRRVIARDEDSLSEEGGGESDMDREDDQEAIEEEEGDYPADDAFQDEGEDVNEEADAVESDHGQERMDDEDRSESPNVTPRHRRESISHHRSSSYTRPRGIVGEEERVQMYDSSDPQHTVAREPSSASAAAAAGGGALSPKSDSLSHIHSHSHSHPSMNAVAAAAHLHLVGGSERRERKRKEMKSRNHDMSSMNQAAAAAAIHPPIHPLAHGAQGPGGVYQPNRAVQHPGLHMYGPPPPHYYPPLQQPPSLPLQPSPYYYYPPPPQPGYLASPHSQLQQTQPLPLLQPSIAIPMQPQQQHPAYYYGWPSQNK